MHTDRPSVRHSHPSASRQVRHQQRVAAWRRAFNRFLPFTGWRVPVLVESAVFAFGRQIGFERIIARGPLSTNSRSAALAIDFSRGIWRSSTLESLEQRRLMALTVGVEEAYVDDSWAGATEGQLLSWTTAAGSEIPLVYGYDAFSTLADGVAALDAGGTLSIAEGTYSEVLATAGKGLTIRAGGDGAAEVTLDGLFLGQGDTLDFDLPSLADYDRFRLTAGASQLDFGSAMLALGSVGDLPTDGSDVLGLVSAEPGLFLGATGTLYDRTGRALADEAIISSSRLDFRFDESSGDFAGIFLTPLVPQDEVTVSGLGSPLSLDDGMVATNNSPPPALVYVYDVWAGATPGATVTYGSISATYGTDAFATIGEGLSGVANAGTVQVIAGAGGVYNEQLTITQDVTIQGIEPGAPPSTDMGASTGAAILDGSGLFNAGITVNGAGIDLILENINLQNWYDGSLLVQAGGTATVTNVTLNGDLSGVASVQRGMRLEAGALTIDKSIFQAANGYGANNAIQVTGGTFTMTASSVTGSAGVNQAGLAISGGTAAVSTSYVTGNFYGVLFSNASSGSVTGSDLSGNTVSALRNIATGGVIVDASTNWWGVTAQADVLAKVYSTGGSRVDITPYLLDGTDSSATAGFQADASQLAVTALGAQFGGTGRIQEGVNSIANGSLTGINRLLFVNDGTYTGGTDVNQSLTLQAANLSLAANFTTSAAVTLEEVTDGAGTVIGVTGAGNNIAINGNTSFSGNGSLTLSSANGSITSSAVLTAANAVLSAPEGGIDVDTDIATLTASADNAIFVNDSGSALRLETVTSVAGDVTIATTAGLTVGTAVEATLGSVSLTGDTLTFTGTTTAAADLALNATGAGLNLAVATLTFGGNLSATAAGAVTQTGVLSVTGTTTLAAGGGLNLPEANTFAQPVAISGSGTMALNVAGPVVLAASTITGNLALTADGAINDSGALSVSGTTTLATGTTNDITLDDANDFVGTVSITSGGNVTLNDVNGFVMGSSNITGDLAITAAGAITDDSSAPIGSGIVLQEEFDYTTGSLNGASGGYGFSNAWVAGTTIASPGLSYGNLATSGNKVLKTNSASMRRLFDNTGLTSDGSVYWFSIVLGSGDSTTEPTQPTNVSFFSDSTGPYAQATGFDFEWDVRSQTSAYFDLRINGSVKTSTTVPGTDYFAETVMIVGKITFSDTTNADQLDLWVNPAFGTEPTSPLLSSTGQWTNPGANNSVFVSMYNAPDRTLDEIRLGTSYAAVTPTTSGAGGGGVITVGGTTTLTAGANDITLDAANDFVGAVTIVSAGDASLNDTNSLDMAASSVTGNLSLTAANDITQSGILTVGGNTTLAAGAAGDVTLSLANVFTGSVGVTRANDVTLNDSGPLAIGASTIAGNLSATANGTITDSGAVAVVGVTTLTATASGSITLDEANDFGGPVNAQTGGSVYLNDTGSIELGTVSAASLAVDANGSITDSGVLTIQGDADFYSYSGADITLDEANDFGAGGSGRLQILKAGNVTLNDINSLAIGQIVASGNLAVTAGGDITDSGVLNITGTTSLTTPADVILDAANIFGNAVSTTNAVNVTLNAASNLTIGTVVGSNVASVIAVTSAATLTVGTAVGGADITLRGAAIALTGTTTGADVTLNATTGSITGSGLVNGTNLTVDAAQSATLNTSVTSLEATVGNDLTVTAAAGFDINNLTIGNDLAITAAGAITQTTAVTVPGNTSLTAGSNPITLTLANDFGGPVTVSSASDVSLNDSNALDLAAITASGNLTVTAGGDLTINGTQAITGEADYTAANLAVDAAIGAANVALNATAGNITGTGLITTAGVTANATGSIALNLTAASLSAAAGTGITATDTDALVLETVSSTTGLASISSGGTLTVNGSVTSQDVSLTGTTLVLDGTVSATRDLALNATAQGFALDGLTVAGNLAVVAGGAITQTGAIGITGTTNLSAAGYDITLGDDTNTFGGAVSLAGDDVTLNTSGALDLGASTISGNLAVTANGTITDSGAILVAGTTTLAAGAANDITLDNANNFGAAVSIVSGRNVTLNDADSIALGASTVSGTLAVTANNAITDTGAITVTGASTLAAGSGSDITLDEANSFGGAVSSSAGGDITLNATGGLTLGLTSATGNLAVTTAGNLAQSAALNITGSTSIIAGTAADPNVFYAITLTNAANDFGGVVNATGASDTYLTVVDAIALGSITTGSLVVVANGDITDEGVLTVRGEIVLTAGSANDITLDQANALHSARVVSGRNVTLNDTNDIYLSGATVSGNLAVTAAGFIDGSFGGNPVTVSGTTTFAAGSTGDITFPLGNNFIGAVSITSGRNVSLRDYSDIDLGGSTISGDLSITANGSITDSAAISVAGSTSLTSLGIFFAPTSLTLGNSFVGPVTLTGSGGLSDVSLIRPISLVPPNGNITLDAANDFTGAVNTSTAASVVLNDTSGIILGDSTIGGSLTVTANGSITDVGTLAVTGTTSLAAGSANDITLDNANTFGGAVSITSGNDVALNDTGAIALGASTVSGNLAVTANGSITDTGAVTVGGTTALTAGSGNDITLDAANDFTGELTIVSGRNVTLNDINSLDLGSATAVSTISGNLTITTAGRLDGGNLAITGTTSLTAGSGNRVVFNATKGPNSFGGTVSIGSGFNVILSTSGPLDLGSSNVTGLLSVTANGSVTDSGPITTTTTLSIDAGSANDITLDQSNNVAALQIKSGNNVVFNDTSGLVMCGSTISGNLALTVRGALSDTGPLTVAGTTAIQQLANGNDITLDDVNDFSGAVSISTSSISPINVTLNDTSALVLGTFSIDGDATITANGAITGSEQLAISGTTTLAAGAANDITLSNSTNSLAGTVSITSADDVTIVNAGNIDLGASTIAGNLSVTAGGTITDSAALAVAGTTTLAAGTITPSQTATWTSGPTSGTVAGITITPSTGSTGTGDFAGDGFVPALAASQSYLDYGVQETVTLTFTAPVTQVDLYLYYWRAPGSSQGPTEYTFSTDGTSALAIQSGLTGASTSGLVLNSAPFGFMNGVLRVTGSFTTLTIVPGTVSGTSRQGLTLTALAAPVNGPYDIVLDDANDFGGVFSVAAANNLTVNDVDDLGLGTVTAAGTVTATAVTDLDVVTSVAAPRVSLTGAELSLAGPITASASTALIATNGSLTGSGLVTTGTLNATATGGIDLQTDIANLTATAGTDVTINDSGDVTLSGITATAGNVSITATGQLTIASSVTAGQDVTLNSTGDSIFGSGLISADHVSANAASSISLNLAADSLDATSAGGSVTVTDAGDLELGTVTTSGSEESVSVTASGNLTVNTSVTATDGISLTGANLQLNGSVTDPTRVTLTATTGTIAGDGLVTANAVVASAPGSVNLNVSANSVNVTSGDDLVITADSAIDLPSLTVTGNLSITANGAITDSGNLTITGTTTLAAGAANDITLDNANNFGGAVSITSADDVVLNDTGAIALGAAQISGNLSVTASGAITQTAVISVAGTTSLTAGSANAITLGELNNFGGAVSIGSGRDVTLQANGGIDLGASTVSGNLAVTAIAGITDSGDLTVSGSSTLSSGCDSMTLGDGSVVSLGGPVTLVSNRDISLNVSGDLALVTAYAGGNLALTASGNLSSSGAVTVAGSSDLSVASDKTIALTQANDFTGPVSLSGLDVSLNDTSGLELGTVGLGGNLSITANGSITDAGNVGVVGTTTLDATGNAITLDSPGNDFGTVNTTGGAVTLVDSDGLTLGDTTATGLTVAAGGAIDQAAGSTIAVSGTATLSAAAGSSITLAEATNDFGTVNGSVSSSGVMTINDSTGIILGNITAQASPGLNVTANGSITQAAGSGLVVFGSRFDSTGNDITLDAAANDFQSNIDTVATGANVTLVDSNALYLGNTTAGNLTATANGVIQDYGPINVTATTTLTAGATNDITLDHPANDFGGAVSIVSGKDVALTDVSALLLGASTISGNLAVTANGSISNDNSPVVPTGIILQEQFDYPTGDLAGNNGGYGFTGPWVTKYGTPTVASPGLTYPDLSTAGNAVLTPAWEYGTRSFSQAGLTADGSVYWFSVLAQATDPTTVGDPTVLPSFFTDSTGPYAQAGGFCFGFGFRVQGSDKVFYLDARVGGSITGTTIPGLDPFAGPYLFVGKITFSDTFNQDRLDIWIDPAGSTPPTSAPALSKTGEWTDPGVNNAFAFSKYDPPDLVFDEVRLGTDYAGVVATGSGSASALTVGGTTRLTAGAANDITLDAANDFGGAVTIVSGADVTLNDSGAIELAASTISGNLAVTANGAITQSGILAVSGNTSLAAGVVNDITLTLANVFGGNVAVGSGANVSLNDTGSLDLGNSTVSGNLAATANGSITDSGDLAVAGTSSLAAGAANDITLDAGNDFGGAVSVASGRDVTLNDINAIDLGDQTVSGNLSVTGASGITDSGNVSVTGSSSFLSGCGSITLGDGNALSLGGPVTLLAGQDTTLTASGAIDLATTTVDGNLSVTAAGAITDSGNLNVGQATTFAAGSVNDILLDAANDFRGPVSIVSGRDVTLNDTNGIDLGASTVANALTVTANGTITDSGTLSVTGLATFAAGSSNDITLDAANELGRVQITSGRDVTLNDVTAVTLTNSTVSGNLAITANGQIKSEGWLNVVGATELSAGSGDIQMSAPAFFGPPNTADFGGPVIVLSGNNVLLNDTNSIQLGNVTTTGTLNVQANGSITGSADLDVGGGTVLNATATHDITLTGTNQFAATVTIQGGNDVTLNAASGFNLDSSVVAGNLAITATGDITDTGASAINGTTTLDAATANITLNAANNFGGAVGVPNANDVTLNDVDAILLGGFTITGNLAITAAGSITDSDSAPTPISVGGSTSLAAGSSNDIVLDAGHDFGGPVSVASGLDVTLNDTGAIDLGEMSVSGNLTVTGATGITDSGNLSVAGSAAFSSGCGSITLGDSSILSVTGPVALIAGVDASITPTAAIDLAASTVGGNLSITANGGITQSGAIVVTGTTTLAAGAANDITLTNVGNDFGGAAAISSGLNVTLADQSTLVLGASTVTGVLNASAGGAISGAGTVAADGLSLTAASGGITLDIAAANVTATATGDISIAQTSNTAVAFASINSTAGNISLATNGTTAGDGMTLGTLAANGGAGSVTVTGGVDVLLTSNSTYTQSSVDAAAVNLAGATLLGSITTGYAPPYGQTYAIILTNGTVTPFANAASDIVFGNVRFTTAYGGNVTLTADRPTEVYVDDLWAGSTPGQTVTSGAVTAIFGYDAFATIATSLPGVAIGGTVNVIAGLYNESVTVSQNVTIQGIQPDADPIAMGSVAGAATLDGTGLFTSGIIVSGSSVTVTIANLNFIEWLNGAVLVQSSGTATVTNSTVTADLAGFAANYGLRLTGGSLTVNKSIVQAGSAGANNGIQVTGGTFVMNESSVTGSSSTGQIGILVSGGSVSVANSFVTGNFAGMSFSGAATGTVTNSDLSGNTAYAIRNGTTSSTINASGNWWGVTAEADVLAEAVTASGVSRIDISPYLLSGTDGESSTAGFQGDFSQLAVTTLGAQAGAGAIQEGVSAIANGSLTGIDRLLVVNAGTYSGATAVNQTLTLQASSISLAGSLAVESATNIAEATNGGGTAITLTGDGNGLTVNAATAFTGNGSLSITAVNGSLTGSGELTADTLSLSAANGSISLGLDVATLTATAGGDATLTEASGIDLAGLTVGGNLSLTANGAITDSGTVNVTGTTTLAAGAAHDITLDGANTFAGTVGITSGRDVTLVDSTDLTMANSAVSGNLALTVTGTISQSGQLTVAGTSNLSTTGVPGSPPYHSIILLNAGNDFGGVVSANSNVDIQLNDSNALTLGTISASTLNVTANGGITDSGTVTLTGALIVAAGSGNDITLDSANTYGAVTITSGRNVTLDVTRSVDVTASTISGNLALTAAGAITQSGALVIAGTTTLAAGGANPITLANAGNDFGGAVSVVSGSTVTLNDTGSIDLGASTISGNLVVSAGGAITDSGNLAIAGTTTLTASTTEAAGVDWTTQASAADQGWVSLAWGGPAGQEKFVAVSYTGTNNVVMTSPDGVTWTTQTPAASIQWYSVVWGGLTGQEQFVAVARTGTGNRVMTSPDGITWTSRTSAADNDWSAVTWGGPAGQEKFVAVATNGAGNRVMTSSDGINWTLRNSAADNNWRSVTWGGPTGQEAFVAVSTNGTGNRVMTSPDGITWTARSSAADNAWLSVTWGGPVGGEQFVAVAETGSGNRVMTSPDGITWTTQASAANNNWCAVTWGGPSGEEQFLATARSGTGNRVMTSPDGVTWTIQTSAAENDWRSVIWGGQTGQEKFVAVSDNGTGNRVMTSGATVTASDITLDAANDFGGAVTITSGLNVTLNDVAAIELATSTIGGNLAVTANGAITQSGAITVAGTTSLAAGGANDITLADAANDFEGAVSVTSGLDVTLVDADEIGLGTATVSGNLAVTANGAITQSGAITVAGTTTLAAGAANAITLADAANDFEGAVTITSGLDVTLVDADEIDLGNATVSGNLAVTANGAIAQSGTITVAGTTSLAAGAANAITLADAANDFEGTVTITSGLDVTLVDADEISLGASTVSGNLAVTANGAISQSGAIAVTGTTSLAAGAANDITLANTANTFGGPVAIASGDDVTLQGYAIDIGESVVSGNLAVTSTTNLTDSGNLSVTGSASFTSGYESITLGDGSVVSLGGPVSLSAGNAAGLTVSGGIDLAAAAISGNLAVTANGAITQSGTLFVSGTTTLAAGSANDITLADSTNSFGGPVVITSADDVTLNETGEIALGASTITGNLAVTAAGNITGSGTVSAAGLTATSASGSITLTTTTDTAAATAAGSISLSQVGNQPVEFTSINSTAGSVILSTDGTSAGQGMTLGALSAGGAGGTVTLTGGVEAEITNGTSYTQITIADGGLVLSGATLLLTRAAGYYPVLGTSFILFQTTEPISGTFTSLAQNGTTDASGVVLEADYGNDFTLTTVSTVPLVTGVYVNASSWTNDFRNYIASSSQGSATLGYAIPSGAVAAFNRATPNQLNTLPWTGINEISVSFSEDVTIAQNDFALTGVNTASYLLVGFSYGQVGGVWTASWALAGNITADKLLVNVAGRVTAAGGGLQLAGDWTTPTPTTAGSAFPSGGSPGTAFLFRMNALPADVNSNTIVNTQDFFLDRAALGSAPGTVTPAYSIFNDVNGNAIVNTADVLTVRSLLSTALPNGEPVPAVFPSASAFAALASNGSLSLAEARQLAWAALGNEFTRQADAQDEE